MNDNVLVLAAAAGMIVKAFIDTLKLGLEMPRWVPPALALVVGPLAVALLQLSEGQVMTLQLAASCIIAGILAAAAAVGVTELGRRGDQSQVQLYKSRTRG